MRARQRRYSAKQQATAVAEVETQETENELDGLLKRSFRPRTNEASEAVRRAIGTLSEYANQARSRSARCRIDH